MSNQTAAALADVTLDDKYALAQGRIYLSGIQALVRLPLTQHRRDVAQKLNTAGFISGYRGSPLGTYDHALWHAKRYLEAEHIHFEPGLNEDLAATAVWGSQQANLFPGAKFDGVFGIWYGKGPGVDRSSDALKHANTAGTSKYGGVLALAGDDHGCQSSTLAHQSEQIFEAAMMPILNPASIQEYLDFGLYGFALSRFSGCWVGFKAISEAAESSASVETDPSRLAIVTPADFEMPAGGVSIRWPDAPLDAERRLHGPKMAAVAAFARANALDRIVLDSPQPRFGIITTGKSYLDVRQALAEIGIDAQVAAAMGLRIYKVGLTWPLEPQGARGFADGLKDVLVVEEKRGFIEDQLVRILYNMEASRRPCVVGKRDETGAPLLPSEGELSPTLVAGAIVNRLLRLGAAGPLLVQRLARLESFERAIDAPKVQRIPFFCSGCPHNTSTRVPEGSRAMAGIGCHGMVLYIPSRRTTTISHMGGEGVNWIGQAPFTSEPHVFQNLGDGTYTHSGLLAIRASAASGVNITYKILVNDAVAMTGGQSVEGGFTVPQIAAQVAAEGARRVVVVTDEPDKYTPSRFASGITVRHRDELDAVQRELRAHRGLTVLIYDQTCAAEKRRRRKRGQMPDLARRVFINDAVCEGCGDCTEQSNCVSVKPLETEFGRKRTIDQSNCNQDFSCLKGFCPSFVSVVGGSVRKPERQQASVADAPFAGLPVPPTPALDRPFSILVTGIGGTGVITIGALIGMAAHLEGKGCTVLDFTGLSQKNGAVMSHVRLARSPDDLAAVRIAPGGADLLLGCDMVVAASSAALSRVEQGATKAVINTALAPTAAFVMNTDVDFQTPEMVRTLRASLGEEMDFVDGTALATALMGDAIATNLFMLGYAFQKGFVPLSLGAIERAIELNGVAIEANRQTFGWGRLAAHDLSKAIAAARPLLPDEPPAPPRLEDVIARRAVFLTEYQDGAYAKRYLTLVTAVKEAEGGRAPGRTELTAAVATNFFKLMAYKDEYEVARLFTDGRFMARLNQQFAGDFKLQFHLAPPFMAGDPGSGHPRKRVFGPWMFTVFRLLARLRHLRGTRFDPFGYTAERRTERALITDYEMLTAEIIGRLGPDNHTLALALASIPEEIRGFGHIKERNLKAAKARAAELLERFRSPQPAIAAE